ncbi:Tat (twin-arginine translocation) pathway signal sequence [Reichenbachiella faecimaris]|uniref:Tat (Twin-arginine translocation) pathway signal sequence n=1 Tax=Reichenbachiella faecimaris TaxID=692418 RepID=A0A1W2GPK7_REIFA|nr:sugar phosphate isomerase/epimerase family protein [Reichenbachiella faecimaris]SMD38577.1 Tat (twin-arginine translocation) pathway signal sequence [Reichenbachiella faecimaris]
MKTNTTRRSFIKQSGLLAGSLTIASSPLLSACSNAMKTVDFKISLAQWSLHKTLFAGKMSHLDFAKVAKKEFGISAVEYVSQFFKDKAKDKDYINQMKQIAADHGVKSLLIMVDGEGELGDNDTAKRTQAVENHYQWIEAAQQLDCHSIRVNAAGLGTAEEVQQNAIEGLRSLSTFAKDYDINVIVENHGGYSSNGQWLNKVISTVDMNNCGTLPDFGNFCITRDENWNCLEDYDRYQGMKDIMPFAKGVSAKSHDFDKEGNEIHSDFAKMLKIVKSAGFKGYIGVEYEGEKLSEYEGIKATKALLDRTIASL